MEAVECTFLDNAAEKSGPDVGGGAVYGDGVGDTVAVNSVFSGNEASNGGAIGALYNGVTIVNVRFLGNQATGSGGTQGGNGGAVYMDGENKPLAVSGAVFTGNAAGNLGSRDLPDRLPHRGDHHRNRAPRPAIYLDGHGTRHESLDGGGQHGLPGLGRALRQQARLQRVGRPRTVRPHQRDLGGQ